MKVSVIIPIYNAEKYIERCVKTLFAQTYTNVEYIFVDDASTDGSLAVLRRMLDVAPAMKNKSIIIACETNGGCNVSRNRGMKAATGDYMIHVDSDDYVAVDYLEKLVNVVVKTNVDVAICGLHYDYGNRCVAREVIPVNSARECLNYVLSGQMHGSLCNKLIRSSIIKEHDIYPTDGITMGEDKQILARVLYYATSVATINEPLYYYNKTNLNSFTSQSKAVFVPSMIELTRQLKSFFIDKNIDQSTITAVDYHSALVLGHILLYGSKESLHEFESVTRVGCRVIIKHPVLPLHYKVAGIAHRLKLNFIIKAIRLAAVRYRSSMKSN